MPEGAPHQAAALQPQRHDKDTVEGHPSIHEFLGMPEDNAQEPYQVNGQIAQVFPGMMEADAVEEVHAAIDPFFQNMQDFDVVPADGPIPNGAQLLDAFEENQSIADLVMTFFLHIWHRISCGC